MNDLRGLDVRIESETQKASAGAPCRLLTPRPASESGEPHARRDDEVGALLEEAGVLRARLLERAAREGVAPGDPAFQDLHRELDAAICQAAREALEREVAEARRARQEQLTFVVHDLRAPLNAIALAADVLERVLPGEDGDALARRMVKSVRRNAEQLTTLADKLLEANAAEAQASPSLERRPVALRQLVREVAQELEPLARAAGARIANEVPEAAIVHADSELLARVFQNLLANAIDHAPGGEISVGAEMSAESDAVVCWVRDDGVGIASQQIERVFDKGATTRGARRARGFGLQIVEQLIEAHGGRVAVESAEGFGATFWFELPGLSRGSRTGC